MKRLLVLAVLLAACGAPAAESTAQGSDPAATTQPATVRTAAPAGSEAAAQPDAPAVPAALDWSVDRLGGGQITGGDLAGGDVVLWFWAPW